jgi:hypothetical protein
MTDDRAADELAVLLAAVITDLHPPLSAPGVFAVGHRCGVLEPTEADVPLLSAAATAWGRRFHDAEAEGRKLPTVAEIVAPFLPSSVAAAGLTRSLAGRETGEGVREPGGAT